MKYFYNFKKIEFDVYGNGQTQTLTDFFRRSKIKPQLFDNVLYYTFYDIKNGERPDVVSQKLYRTPAYHWTFGLVNPWLIDVRTDWPMSTYELQTYIDEKYTNHCFMINDIAIASMFEIGEEIQGLVSNAKATIIAKDVNLGYIKIKINSGTFQNNELVYGLTTGDYIAIDSIREFRNAPHHYELVDGSACDRFTVGAQPITNAEYELKINEGNVRIRVIRPEYIQQIASLFTQLVK